MACSGCQARLRFCITCQERDDQLSQAVSSVLVALERWPVPVTGYTSQQRRAHLNMYIRRCLSRIDSIRVNQSTAAPQRSLPAPRPRPAPNNTLTSLDPVSDDMLAWLNTEGDRSSVPPEADMWRVRLDRLAFLENLDEAQPRYDYGGLLSWRLPRTEVDAVEMQRLAALAPHARIATATRAARIEDENVRAAYTLDRLPARPAVIWACTWCGHPTANRCRTCAVAADGRCALCHLCAEDFSECRSCRSQTMVRDVQPTGLGA